MCNIISQHNATATLPIAIATKSYLHLRCYKGDPDPAWIYKYLKDYFKCNNFE